MEDHNNYSSIESMEASGFRKKIMRIASQPFEGTSLQRRLMSKIKISLVKFLKGIFIGLFLGFPLVCFGPLIIVVHTILYQRKLEKRVPPIILFLLLIISLALSFFNSLALYMIIAHYRKLIYLAVYLGVAIPFVMIVLDSAYEYARDRNMTAGGLLSLFMIQNPQIGAFHFLGYRASPYFEKVYKYMNVVIQNTNPEFKKEKSTYFVITIIIYCIIASGFFLTLPSFFNTGEDLLVSIGIFSLLLTVFYSSVITIYFELNKYLEVEEAYEALKKNPFEPETYIQTYERVFHLVNAIKASIRKQFFYTYGNIILILVYLSCAVCGLSDSCEFLTGVGSLQIGFLNFCLIAFVYFSFPSLSKIYYGFLINFVFKETSDLITAVHNVAKLLRIRSQGLDYSKDGWFDSLTSGGKALSTIEDCDDLEATILLDERLHQIVKHLPNNPKEIKESLVRYFEQLAAHTKFCKIESENLIDEGTYKFLGLFALNENLVTGLIVSLMTIFIANLFPSISNLSGG